ncbi:MAG: ABC transporter substrate-binding protein [Noviherbaspirillum sp.]
MIDMIRLLLVLTYAAVALLLASGTALARELKIVVVSDADDQRYERKRLDKLYPGHPLDRPQAGAQVAIAESAFQLAQAKLNVGLQEVAADGMPAAKSQIEALAKQGVRHFLLDLPGTAVAELAQHFSRAELLLFNVSAADNFLRREGCSANLFHTLPDDSMSADALAQFLTARKWTRVLLLTGGSPDDQARVAAAHKAIKRYGLKLVAARPFKLSNDPRERDAANVALLTANADADVIWVADADGEFAREVPYRSMLPRPVVGSAGLVAEAWHASWERHGAPQLNRRFKKTENRLMAGSDWAAWIATKAIIDVALQTPDVSRQRRALRDPGLALDGFKGARLSFRAWDQQLRQPVFLAHGGFGGGIAGVAPFDGFLHPVNNLDTLGTDEKESPCRLADSAGKS